MRSQFEMLVMQKTFDQVLNSSNSDFLDHVLTTQPEEIEQALALKNVCAKVPAILAEDIDLVCNLLHVSKRQFLELAFIEAVTRAKNIMRAEGMDEALLTPWQTVETVQEVA